MAAVQAHGQSLLPSVTTNKGCRESGQDPVFAIGERLTVSFRIGSASLSAATASITDYASNDRITVFSFGQVATNRTYSFLARVGGASGNETLVLRASAPGATTQRRSCSFTVSDGTPSVTRTPTFTRVPSVTRTPKPTRTAPSGATATRTPAGGLSGDLQTSRGCREDGDAATFAVGEPITLAFRIGSDSQARVNASIVDTRPDGVQTVFSFGSVPTNVLLLFPGRVGPPDGIHALRLRAGSQTLATCSFLVAGSAPPTATRIATRTPAATRTRTPARTPTRPRTATATPTPAGCVGACTTGNTVTVNDLLKVIEIAADRRPLSDCPIADANGDEQVSLDEVLQAVTNALDGCPA